MLPAETNDTSNSIVSGDLQSVVSAEVDQQIRTAKHFPRDLKRFRNNAEAFVAQSEEVASSCIYSLPRGGKEIKGPSVRLAEIVAQCWGNLHCAMRIVDVGPRTITAQAVAWDLESNVKITSEVKRSIVDRYGKRYSEDMIIVTGNAAASIALRNAIFKVIPRAIVDPIYATAVQVALGEAKSLNERRTKMFDVFSKMGVTKEKVLTLLGHTDEIQITRDDIESLIGIRNAIKDGAAKIEDYFIEEETKPKIENKTASKTQKLADELADQL